MDRAKYAEGTCKSPKCSCQSRSHMRDGCYNNPSASTLLSARLTHISAQNEVERRAGRPYNERVIKDGRTIFLSQSLQTTPQGCKILKNLPRALRYPWLACTFAFPSKSKLRSAPYVLQKIIQVLINIIQHMWWRLVRPHLVLENACSRRVSHIDQAN